MRRLAIWPSTDEHLVAVQHALAAEADAEVEAHPWTPGSPPVIGGCFVPLPGARSAPRGS